jgi:hypothetical protein
MVQKIREIHCLSANNGTGTHVVFVRGDVLNPQEQWICHHSKKSFQRLVQLLIREGWRFSPYYDVCAWIAYPPGWRENK